ncbi:MAG TPA: SRPBCC family protein [Nocardioides sp.]|nr:SRPBCC family protein [Nocardioides sp.]
MVVVPFPVAPEVAFDYLADPRNRPDWQSSLARVEDVDGEPRVGQTWVDVTRPGLRPRMETTELDRPRRWTERGTWHGVTATLTLDFVATPTGCDVTATFQIARLLRAPALWAVRGDLRRAAGKLSS